MDDFFLSSNFVIAFLVVVATIVLFRGKRQSRTNSVEACLNSLGSEYTSFKDILVTLNSGMYRISCLVVSRYGVFLIDERSEQGTVQVNIDQREWLVSSAGSKDYIYNPVWRAREAVNKLNDKGESIPIISLIVFTEAKLKNNSSKDVVLLRDLPSRIKKEIKVIIDDEKLKVILDRLEKKNK